RSPPAPAWCRSSTRGAASCPKDFESFSLPYLQRIVAALQANGAPVILFGTGMSTLLPLMRSTGADVLGLDWRIAIAEAPRLLGPQVAVQGNLAPAALFLPTAELESRVQDLLQGAGPMGHIFNLGHGIFPQTPPEAAQALVDAVHRLSARVRRG